MGGEGGLSGMVGGVRRQKPINSISIRVVVVVDVVVVLSMNTNLIGPR